MLYMEKCENEGSEKPRNVFPNIDRRSWRIILKELSTKFQTLTGFLCCCLAVDVKLF